MILIPDYDLGTARGTIHLDASSLGRASAAFAVLGKSLLGFSAVAVGGFAYVVKTAADFERVMSAVRAVTKATDEQMDQLTQTALDMATQTIYSAEEIAEAMEQLGKAGISVEDMLGGATQATVDLAAAAGEELPGGVGRAAEVIANAAKTFNASAEDLQHFADVLVGAAAASTTSVEDLAVSMKYVGPIAAALGLDIDSLGAALALLGDRGIRGSTAGTSLRGVLIALTPQSKKATEQMKELGLITEEGTNRFYDLEGNLKSLPQVMQLLQDATRGLSQEEKVSAFNTIFRRRAMASALIMAEQGAAGYKEYADAMAELNAADIAATKLDNLHGDMLILRQTVDSLVTEVGLEFQDMLRAWVQSLTDVVEWVRQLDTETLAMGLQYIALAGAIAGVLGAFSLMISMAVKMYANFIVLKEGIALVLGAMKLLVTSFLLNPWVLLAAAIAGIGYALYETYQRGGAFADWWDSFFEKIRPAIDAISNFISTFVDSFQRLWELFDAGTMNANLFSNLIDKAFGDTGALVGPIRSIIDVVNEFWDGLSRLYRLLDSGQANIKNVGSLLDGMFGDTSFASTFLNTIQTVISWISDEAIPAIVDFGERVQYWFGLIADKVVPFVTEKFNEMASFIRDIMPDIQEAVGNVWDFIYGKILFIVEGITAAIDIIMALWRAWGDDLENIVGTVWTYIQTAISSAMKIIQGVIKTVVSLINGDWGAAWDGIKMILAGAWDWIVGIIKGAVGLIRSIIGGILSTISEIWAYFWGGISTFFSGIWETIIETIGQAVIDVVEFFAGLPGKIWEALGNLGEDIYNFFVEAAANVLTAVSLEVTRLLSWLGGLPEDILEVLGDARDWLYETGKDVIQGLIDGIQDMSEGGLVGALGEIGGLIVENKGPPREDAKLLMNNGSLIMQGLIDGIRATVPQLQSVLSSIGPQIPSMMSLASSTPALDYNALASTIQSSMPMQPLVGEQKFYGDPYRNAREMDTELRALARRGR